MNGLFIIWIRDNALEASYSPYLTIPIYLAAELVLIYVLLCTTSLKTRAFAHWGVCLSWLLLLVFIIPQPFAELKGILFVVTAALTYILKFPGEGLVELICPIKSEYDGPEDFGFQSIDNVDMFAELAKRAKEKKEAERLLSQE